MTTWLMDFSPRVMSGGSESQSDLPAVLETLKEVPALPEITSHSRTRIAQLGERWTRYPKVVGSNPTPGRNFRISTNHSKTNRNLLLDHNHGLNYSNKNWVFSLTWLDVFEFTSRVVPQYSFLVFFHTITFAILEVHCRYQLCTFHTQAWFFYFFQHCSILLLILQAFVPSEPNHFSPRNYIIRLSFAATWCLRINTLGRTLELFFRMQNVCQWF